MNRFYTQPLFHYLWGMALIILLFGAGCQRHVHLAKTTYVSQRTTEDIGEDSAIQALIMPYKYELVEEMNVVVGQLAKDLTIGEPESTLGNFVADLLYDQTSIYYDGAIDFAIVNTGGLRVPTLQQGNIMKRNIFELMPFDNLLVIMPMDATTLRQLFDAMASYGGWPISRQVRYVIKEGKPENITINGKPIDSSRTYNVVLFDYLANGGDRLFFPKG